MWTLILSITIAMSTHSGVSTHTVIVPNIPTREACRAAGQDHVDKYLKNTPTWPGDPQYVKSAAVYTCVEAK